MVQNPGLNIDNFGISNFVTTHPDNEKRFSCNMCGRMYKYIRSVKHHQKHECGKEPKFECHVCHKRFYYRGNMKQHISVVHRILSFSP